ncbi:MAG: phospholipase D-like domain-containing protein, partial [Myxococcota bacterium]
GERLRERHTRNALVALLDASRESALLTTPYFLPDRRLRRALGRAALRGVRVELLTAGRSDHPWILRAARAELPSLLRRGVRVWLYDAAMLHAKVALFDGRIALVGTSNLDRQSLHRNLEVNLRIEGDPAVGALLRGFERDRTRSVELSLQDTAHRRVWDRILDELCRLASRLV